MPGMLVLRSSIKRLLALALLVCLGWTLLACVLVCATHDEEPAQPSDSIIAIAAPHEDDCCPIVAPAFVRPERQSVAVSSRAIDAALFTPEKVALAAGVQVRTFTPAFSPPFTRLCTLRI
jgi:hypothetical protein